MQKIKGGCQSGRKVVTHNSKSDLPLTSANDWLDKTDNEVGGRLVPATSMLIDAPPGLSLDEVEDIEPLELGRDRWDRIWPKKRGDSSALAKSKLAI